MAYSERGYHSQDLNQAATNAVGRRPMRAVGKRQAPVKEERLEKQKVVIVPLPMWRIPRSNMLGRPAERR